MRTVIDTHSGFPLLDEKPGRSRDPHPADPGPPETRDELEEELTWCHMQLMHWATDGHLIARDEVIHQYRQRIEFAEAMLAAFGGE